MIPKECKRLAEVDFPIAVVSRHSAREKSIRHGHPSTLHLWWARRPLAACRAMLLALVLPDPCDLNCPAEFKQKAHRLLLGIYNQPTEAGDEKLRAALLRFIGDFANWDNAAKPRYVEVGRGLVKAAHGEETPLVVDPFAGGGSIPLEGLRLGCDAFASDLNPVACLILKVMLEDIPRHGRELAEEVRRVGGELKKHAERELAQYYPRDMDAARPIAYLWARTVRCESSKCGIEIPLLRSFWLCKRPDRRSALRYRVEAGNGKLPAVEFEIFKPEGDSEVQLGTITQARVTCVACGHVLSPDRVRAQLSEQHGGADVVFDERGHRVGGALLLAVVTSHPHEPGRFYRLPLNRDYEAVRDAVARLRELLAEPTAGGLSLLPSEPIPHERVWKNNPIRVHHYGMGRWADLFTSRQALGLVTLVRELRAAKPIGEREQAIRRALALAVSRQTDYQSALCSWNLAREVIGHTFTRQALPMIWDFVEVDPFSGKSGGFDGAIDWVAQVYMESPPAVRPGQVIIADAAQNPLPSDVASVMFTDPPYYDAVPYAKLSNYFYVWQRRTLFDEHPDLYGPTTLDGLTECVVDEARGQDRAYFEQKMAVALGEGRRVIDDGGIGCVVFAHKTTEGWEALLSGMIKAGWTITGSWPIATEMGARLRARESAALATSVHLVCRPRAEHEVIGDWAELFQELPNRIGDWMERLSSEGVRGADLVFACIGPALEIYSRYSRVEDAEGREIPLGGDPEATDPHERGFLAYVWEIVGRTALGHVLGTAEARARNGAAGALEEDSRLTALFLWTHQSTSANGAEAEGPDQEKVVLEPDESDADEDTGANGKKGLTLIYDVVRRFSQPLGIHLENWEDRIIEIKKGIVRLLPVRERAEVLLGEDGASGAADLIERSSGGPLQLSLGYDKMPEAPRRRSGGKKAGKGTRPDEAPTIAPGMTTLDRVHIAMLLQAAGKSNALRTMLKAESERGQDFVRLANALSALYPRDSEEKRLVDAMLLAMPK